MDGQLQFKITHSIIFTTFCPQLFDEKWFILSDVLVPQNIVVVVCAGAAQQMHRPVT